MSCAACAARIEDALRKAPGIAAVTADPATAEARVSFDNRMTSLAVICEAIDALGFRAARAGSAARDRAALQERRAALKRLAVAWLGMMQTMMLALALYQSDAYRIDPAAVGLLRYCSLIVAVPATLYAGLPIFRAALAQLRQLQPGMDVPVGLGLVLALGSSVLHTFQGTGPVYFDSAMMFVSFLGTARFVEFTTRHEYGSATDALAALLPDRALLWRNGATELVAAAELRPGDLVQVNRGERVPADGFITTGSTAVDESLLTGESTPAARKAGDLLIGGSINLGAPVSARVCAPVDGGTVAGIVRLLERSRTRKPRTLTLASRAARIFSTAILFLAAVVFCGWLVVRPAGAFEAMVAVLVVACPCALALAAPVVNAAANGALARLGLLPISADAIEQLAGVRTVIVDKTGTLTQGRPSVRVAAAGRASAADALAIAAALERHSAHPLATAFRCHERPDVQATEALEHAGEGVEGSIAGRRYRVGSPRFAAALHGEPAHAPEGGSCVLADDAGPLAVFHVEDPVRADAREAIAALNRRGYEVEIASGDSPAVVAAVAADVGIARWQARLMPAEKVALLERRQAGKGAVLMIGDGINDAPVMAAAHVSIAMHAGSGLAHASADLVLLDSAWMNIPRALALARRARRILQQNLAWAIAYNLAATPAAALGYVPPWLAALGMSLSSVLVVLNGRRVASQPMRDATGLAGPRSSDPQPRSVLEARA